MASAARDTETLVTPHRNHAVVDAEKDPPDLKLQRQLKGLLNRYYRSFDSSFPSDPDPVTCRMSEQNIAAILDSIEDVYRNHRRHG